MHICACKVPALRNLHPHLYTLLHIHTCIYTYISLTNRTLVAGELRVQTKSFAVLQRGQEFMTTFMAFRLLAEDVGDKEVNIHRAGDSGQILGRILVARILGRILAWLGYCLASGYCPGILPRRLPRRLPRDTASGYWCLEYCLRLWLGYY